MRRRERVGVGIIGIALAVLALCLSAGRSRADDATAATPPPPPSPAAASASALKAGTADGPASDTTTTPAERLRSAGGLVLILGLAFLLSENRRAISRRVVFWGLALQWAFALIVLRVPRGRAALSWAGKVVERVLACAQEGAAFLFGAKLADPEGPGGFVFAFRVLPTVIFVAALFAVLYHLGVMQWIVRGFAWVMARLMGASGAESLNVAASLFLGQTEAPLTIRPFLPRLTRSELLTVMTSGMAHVSGGVMAAYFAFGVEPRHILTAVIMTAPGTILLAKLLIPETEVPETLGTIRHDDEKPDANLLDAASRGTREGLGLALNIAAMLISFLGLIALVNLVLGQAGTSLQAMFGYVMAPVAYMLGVPWADCGAVGGLLGTRTVLNELIAYGELGALKDQLAPRSFTIATFALCGFANLSSIGIQLGGIGSLAPERRTDLARLGFKALLAGTLANYLSACIAGILL
jgi:CNT family concentrative nucleoside transporter